jgi:hypothetical protein
MELSQKMTYEKLGKQIRVIQIILQGSNTFTTKEVWLGLSFKLQPLFGIGDFQIRQRVTPLLN